MLLDQNLPAMFLHQVSAACISALLVSGTVAASFTTKQVAESW
jgi:hypothetical protein